MPFNVQSLVPNNVLAYSRPEAGRAGSADIRPAARLKNVKRVSYTDLCVYCALPHDATGTIMAQFNFSIDTSYRLLARARDVGLSEEELINRLLDMETATTDAPIPYKEALELAVQAAKAKPKGAEFRLEELYTPAQWARVQAKKHVGRFFRTAAEHDTVEHIGKSDANHAIYRRL